LYWLEADVAEVDGDAEVEGFALVLGLALGLELTLVLGLALAFGAFAAGALTGSDANTVDILALAGAKVAVAALATSRSPTLDRP
jgi:hypothetical protein